MSTGRLVRLRDYVEFSQGEVNETNQRQAGNLCGPNEGKLVIRGANICSYIMRPASQGNAIYLDTEKFLLNAGGDSKAFHHRYERVAVQESSPQNNFRRVIAALVPAGEFCNHKINYVPANKCALPLKFAAALLNSDLIDWYFRLGSTNAAVSHYQLLNLPCPDFDVPRQPSESALIQIASSIEKNEVMTVETCLAKLVAQPPFDPTIAFAIAAVVDEIIKAERARGEIQRSARSRLAGNAQAWQDVLNRTFALMAGISPTEHKALNERLGKML